MILDWKLLVAFGGWFLAATQFILTYKETKNRNQSELLEKTLGYFERDSKARAIGISLVKAIWFKQKINLDVIIPVLISQVSYLLHEPEPKEQDKNDFYRLQSLIYDCLPYSADRDEETRRIADILLKAGRNGNSLGIKKSSLRCWFERYRGDTVDFDSACNL